nr:integrase, catalytic region, zinc finger, CCHC-type, peptidase aspartic, catalytic [Tanacetum cinerariifolium]
CSKHMMGDRSRLKNFVKNFIGTVRFGNDHFGAIMGYGGYIIGDSVISRVYYVEGLGHNLFFVGQFCDSDLEVAFRKHSCYVRETDGVELIKGSRSLQEQMMVMALAFKPLELCENLEKLQPTADIGIFVGYAPSRKDTMADVNVNAPTNQAPTMAPSTHTDDQILPHIRWHANFFKAFTDEQWFDLTKDTLRDALQITPVNNNQSFTSPPSSDALINFLNELRYPKLYHLQRKHKFHPRPDSPLHFPNEEPILGYLKFNAKGTKREVFGMPIPGNLIITDIQGESYYQEYLAKVAKHQRYLVGETGSDPDSPAPKLTKTAKKSKQTAPKADPRPPVSKPASSKQPEPNPHQPRLKERSASWALEESLKSIYDVPRGPLPPMVIRELESEKYQPLSEVSGKGKEKVTEEQVARDLLTLQTPKKKSPADRYIFQRRTSTPTGSSSHDESSSLYVELGLMDSEEEFDEDVLGTNAGVQGEGQAGPNPDAQDEGQAGSNPDEQVEGLARPNPGDAEACQPLPSPVVHAGSDFKHMDLDVADVSTQPHPEQMDERFTATTYLKVQENLKLTVEEHVILEEPASSSGTLSSLQHLTKDLRFGDLFFSDKPSEADNDKATAETEAESMLLKATATETTTTTIHPPPSQPQQSTINSMLMKRIDELEHIMENLIQDNKQLEQRLDSYGAPHKKKKKRCDSPKTPLGSPPHQPPPPSPPAGPFGASGSPGTSGSLQVLPPPHPPPSTNQEGQSKGSAAPSSSKIAASAKYQAWTTINTRLRSSISLTHADLQIDDDMAPDAQAQSSDDEDIRNAHIPKVNLRQDWWKPLKEERPATPERAWSIPSSDVPVLKNNWASALASTYSSPPEDSLLTQTDDIAMFIDWYNVSKPLPLGGPPGQVTIQSDFFFKKDLEYLRYGSNGSRHALSISKMKAAYYPNVGLEKMVPDQTWIEDECKYDIAAMYGISHWWFQRQRFYIDRHTSEGDPRVVRTHMCNTPKNVSQRKYVSEALLHNTTSQDIRERPLNVV